jgi:hypothetical protein
MEKKGDETGGYAQLRYVCR